MSENKIRKVGSGGMRPTSGPASAGIFFDSVKDGIVCNPDGTERIHTNLLIANLPLNANLGAAAQALIIVPFACQVTSIKHVVAVGVAGATATIKKTSGTTAPGSGTTQHTGTLDLNATANTVTTATLSSTLSDIQLAAGDRLWFTPSTGTLTGLSGAVTITLKRI